MTEFQAADLNISFYCPITQELMEDPVSDREGNSFERAAIEHWLRVKSVSPLTRTPMQVSSLVPNRALKAAIDSARGLVPSRRPGGIALDPNFVPAVAPAPELQLQVTSLPAEVVMGTEGTGKTMVMSNIVSSAALDRTPLDVVVCIDTSGSMGTEAIAQGVESSGLSMLDIVKHAVRTIIMTLGNQDRIGIVSYSNAARRVCELCAMTEAGRTAAIAKLATLQEEGMTNLWDGLRQSLDMLQQRSSDHIDGVPGSARSAAIYLLTDGVPNVDPPRGYVPSMQRYRDQNGGRYPAVINTFGFGYNLKSDLLLEMAQEGQGIYAFIPDSGFVGTVFVNALGNALTTMASQVKVAVSAERAENVLVPVSVYDTEVQSSPDSVNFTAKTIQVGQPYGALCLVDDVDMPQVMANLQYTPNTSFEALTVSTVGPVTISTEAERQEIAAEFFRISTVNCIIRCIAHAKAGEYSATGRDITQLVTLINRWMDNTTQCVPPAIPEETSAATAARIRVDGLKQDLDGQIREACSKEEFFLKWGLHFLRSIMRAHQLKQCNNFKDPGVQYYGNTLFTTCRDEADDRFTDLPPPVPKRPSYVAYGGRGAPYTNYNTNAGVARAAAPPPAAPASMASYNDRSRGCFHAHAIVTMQHGLKKKAENVKIGDILYDGGIVKCVVKTLVSEGKFQMIRLPCIDTEDGEDHQGLLITPYHPIEWQGKWVFPIDVGQWIDVSCDAVYSYLVQSKSSSEDTDSTHAMTYATSAIVDGIPTSMLAHGVKDVENLSHDFFGTHSVVHALKQCPGYDKGLVVFSSGGYFVRDAVTNDVCGIDTSLAMTC